MSFSGLHGNHRGSMANSRPKQPSKPSVQHPLQSQLSIDLRNSVHHQSQHLAKATSLRIPPQGTSADEGTVILQKLTSVMMFGNLIVFCIFLLNIFQFLLQNLTIETTSVIAIPFLIYSLLTFLIEFIWSSSSSHANYYKACSWLNRIISLSVAILFMVAHFVAVSTQILMICYILLIISVLIKLFQTWADYKRSSTQELRIVLILQTMLAASEIVFRLQLMIFFIFAEIANGKCSFSLEINVLTVPTYILVVVLTCLSVQAIITLTTSSTVLRCQKYTLTVWIGSFPFLILVTYLCGISTIEASSYSARSSQVIVPNLIISLIILTFGVYLHHMLHKSASAASGNQIVPNVPNTSGITSSTKIKLPSGSSTSRIPHSASTINQQLSQERVIIKNEVGNNSPSTLPSTHIGPIADPELRALPQLAKKPDMTSQQDTRSPTFQQQEQILNDSIFGKPKVPSPTHMGSFTQFISNSTRNLDRDQSSAHFADLHENSNNPPRPNQVQNILEGINHESQGRIGNEILENPDSDSESKSKQSKSEEEEAINFVLKQNSERFIPLDQVDLKNLIRPVNKTATMMQFLKSPRSEPKGNAILKVKKPKEGEELDQAAKKAKEKLEQKREKSPMLLPIDVDHMDDPELEIATPIGVVAKTKEKNEAAQNEMSDIKKLEVTLKMYDILEKRSILNNKQKKCGLCCDRQSDVIFQPCGHSGICFDCFLVMVEQSNVQCFFCRSEISKVYRIDITKTYKDIYRIVDCFKVETSE